MRYGNNITKLIRAEGLVGLQKLEAEGIIQGDFKESGGNIYKRGGDRQMAFLIARGIGFHSDPLKVMEMIDWLRDGDYLIDYGMITVALAESMKQENAVSLAESKFKKTLDYIRFFENFFCVYFLLEHQKKFSEEFNDWLLKIRDETLATMGKDMMLVKTRIGYSCINKGDYKGSMTAKDPVMKNCVSNGKHFERYRGEYETK